jgi:hypothetical protein
LNAFHHQGTTHFEVVSEITDILETKKRMGEEVVQFCMRDDAKRYGETFQNNNFDQGNCPREDWLPSLAAIDQPGHKVLLTIGTDTGADIAAFMNVFLPKTGITPDAWFRSLRSHLKDPATQSLCGECNACKKTFAISPSLKNIDNQITIIATDIHCDNLRIIQENLFSFPSVQANAFNVSFYSICAGFGYSSGWARNSAGYLSAQRCSFGDHSCDVQKTEHLAHDSADLITLPALSIDFLMEMYLKDVTARLKKSSSEYSSYRRLYHFYYNDSAARPYQPLVDLLMINGNGRDMQILEQSEGLLRGRSVRAVVFRHHGGLEGTKRLLEQFGYACYFEGQGRLWRFTGKNCWHATFETGFLGTARVFCVRREDVWFDDVQPFVAPVPRPPPKPLPKTSNSIHSINSHRIPSAR